jgi:phosphodiesterase/alkaline phosphatase D-like protein
MLFCHRRAATPLLLAAVLASPAAADLPNGVAAGDTDQGSSVLWTRSDTVGATVQFQYSTDPGFGTFQTTGLLTVTDALLPVKTTVSGLDAGTRYFYRPVETTTGGATTGPVGTFRTLNPLGQRTGLRFGISGDWRGELAPFPAISNIPTYDPANPGSADGLLDFFVALGDTIYADDDSPAVTGPNADQARTLGEFRAKHNENYSAHGFNYATHSTATPGGEFNYWAPVRGSTSLFATIDDHEVTDNFAGGADISTDARFNQNSAGTSTRINDSDLYEVGMQTFQEWNPLLDEFYPGAPELGRDSDDRFAGERRLFRERSFGSDAALIVMDNRSFRDAEIGQASTLPTDAQTGSNWFDDSRTLLGDQQLQDVMDSLTQAQDDGVTWKFVITGQPIQQLGSLQAGDRYEGYYAERSELLGHIRDNGIQNVVFVTADIHGTLANNLAYDPLNTPNIPTDTVAAFPVAALQDPQTPGLLQTGAWEISSGAVAYEPPLGEVYLFALDGLGVLDIDSGDGQLLLSLINQDAQVANILAKAGFEALFRSPDPVLGPVPDIGLGPQAFDGIDADVIKPDGPSDFSLTTDQQAQLDQAEALLQTLLATGGTQLGALLNTELAQLDDRDFSDPDSLPPSVFEDFAYFQTTTFGWTEFEIDELTGELTVKTWGIPSYSPETREAILDNPLLTDPQKLALLNPDPSLLASFVVTPVPEPATAGLLIAGLAAGLRRRRQPLQCRP